MAIPNEDHIGFNANGYCGQFIYVVPDLDLVVVTTTFDMDSNETERQQRPRPIMEELIVP